MPSSESADSRLEDYADRYRDHFVLTRTDGVLEIRMHTGGGPAMFSLGLKHALGRLWRDVAADPGNEVIIFTGTGESWIGGVDPESFATMNSVQHLPAEQAYQLLYADGLAMIQDLVLLVEVPTIGVINGPGPRKETALMCDITLCADHATISDGNFALGHAPPGDGMHLVLQEALGAKRAAYYLLTGTAIDAPHALQLGLVDEVLPAGELMPRAQELARQILASPASSRRLAHAITQRPWRKRVVDELGSGLAHVAFGARLGLGQHSEKPQRP